MTVDDLFEKATEQRRRGRNDEALISARKATKLDPLNADAFWQLALCQLDTGAAASAIGSVKRSLSLHRFLPARLDAVGFGSTGQR